MPVTLDMLFRQCQDGRSGGSGHDMIGDPFRLVRRDTNAKPFAIQAVMHGDQDHLRHHQQPRHQDQPARDQPRDGWPREGGLVIMARHHGAATSRSR